MICTVFVLQSHGVVQSEIPPSSKHAETVDHDERRTVELYRLHEFSWGNTFREPDCRGTKSAHQLTIVNNPGPNSFSNAFRLLCLLKLPSDWSAPRIMRIMHRNQHPPTSLLKHPAALWHNTHSSLLKRLQNHTKHIHISPQILRKQPRGNKHLF